MTGITSGFTGAGYEALIMSGDGVGEHVRVTGYNAATGVLTLAGPWQVTPDSTSVVSLGMVLDGMVVYQNKLQGKGVTDTASAGFELWGGGLNVIVDSNTMSNMRYGILDSALDESGQVDPSFFNLFRNNTITNVQTGIVIENDGTSGQIGMLGAVVRDNQITGASDQAFLFRDQVDHGNQHFYLIVEENTATNDPVGVSISNLGTATTNLVLNDNTFSLGSAAKTGSAAINVGEGLVLTEAGNSITGFGQTFNGTVTATIATAHLAGGNTVQLPAIQIQTVTVPPVTTASSATSSQTSSSQSASKTSTAPKYAAGNPPPAAALLANIAFIESYTALLLKDMNTGTGSTTAKT
jgi:hypothetical protein